MSDLKLEPGCVYKYKEVQKLLNISKDTASKYVRSGQLSPSIVGDKYLFFGEELIKFLNSSKKLTVVQKPNDKN